MMEDLDPEKARAIIDPALKLMMDSVHRYDGYVVQSTGDGIFALFGAPVAHEDHPQTLTLRRAPNAGGVAPLFGKGGRRRRHSYPGPHRYQHWRSSGAFDSYRRGSCRVHADRSHDQSRLADADGSAGGLDRC